MRSILAATLLAVAGPAAAVSVAGSKHDLSVTGPGPIKADTETRVCIFCHVSHGAAGSAQHLSNRPEIRNDHRPYASSTSRSTSVSPTGASRVCLSCHDGTIAVGATLRGEIRVKGASAGGMIPQAHRSNLGTDLRKTHPVSVDARASGMRQPSPGSHVKLYMGQVQCTSCHDPHVEVGPAPEGKFLRETARGGQLCASCHLVPGKASHLTSSRAFGAAQGNEAGFRSVADAGCQACHRSHGADARGWLLARTDQEPDDALCLRCHSGAASAVDVARDLSKAYAHAMPAGGRHDAAEGRDGKPDRLPERSAGAARHVACVDCHDPHEANDTRATAPRASGRLAGVWGIDLSGQRVQPVSFEYEVCFKCHADSANKPARGGGRFGAPRRAADDDNLRRVFDPNAPSSHPVAAPRSAGAPSLVPPLTAGSQVYCSDCHASDGAGTPGVARGPHGSIYASLLERNYTTGNAALESPSAYALCYKCHDRDVLLSARSSFPLHRRHVVDSQTPCSVCHASHGVSALRGTPVANAHLIDFDLNVVRVTAAQPYTASGARGGTCSVSCHGKTHDAARY